MDKHKKTTRHIMTAITHKTFGELVDHEERMIASKLFRLRNKLGIEREELASIVGITELELTNYEQAIEAIPASVLIGVASVMGVSFDYFYQEDDVEICNDNRFISAQHTALQVN
jgi:transcriptional regulator with XRE-family HTH domain